MLSLEVSLRPFCFTLRRGERRLLREATVWACDGEVHDRFVALTEGVMARETRGFAERAADAIDLGGGLYDVRLRGGRHGTLSLSLGDERLDVELVAEGEPLRLGLEWRGRADERFAGLGARHHGRVDHAGRTVQLGADRRYLGPDCPPDLLELGGIPQGDYAPAPWVQSSRGYAVWSRGFGNGTVFDFQDPVALSTRSSAGPLRATVFTSPTPAARLRRLLDETGMPALLPEWGYGFWKSRDVYPHQNDVLEDLHGCRWHGIPVDAVVLDSPWATQYNTWVPNPHQFPDFGGMVRRMRDGGVRTVVWVTPWVNLRSDNDSQIPPDPASQRLHRERAPNYEPERFVRGSDGEPFVARWWMGVGSPVDFTAGESEMWWREQAKRVLELGVEGIKADDGEGYYMPEEVRFADGRSGGEAAWAYGGLYRRSMQRALDEVHPGRGVLFGRSGWSGEQATGVVWAGDQASDFWSLRTLVAAALSAAGSGFSNWSHDVGGYLGHRLVERAPAELLVRWAQLGCFTPLMQAHARLQQEPWTYGRRVLDVYRAYVVLHERLVPYIRAAAATARRAGLPIVRPLSLVDPADARGWQIADAFGFGPALWVAPVLDPGAREREVPLPRGRWIETWSGERVDGGDEVAVEAPLERIPVWVRDGSIVVTYPADHVAGGLGDVPERERPLEATLWGEPTLGRAAVRLADGTQIAWRRGRWTVTPQRDVAFTER